MTATVRDLILILEAFFPGDLALHQALYLLGVILSLYPLFRLHRNQQRQPPWRARTAWLASIRDLLVAAFQPEDAEFSIWASGLDRSGEYADYISDDLGAHISCIFCPPGDSNIIPTLRRQEEPQSVWLLDDACRWVEADLLLAHCISCHADYYPDCVTYRDGGNKRRQQLDMAPQRIAWLQENALNRFHGGWSNFADWINDSTGAKRNLTLSHKALQLSMHFSQRLLLFPEKDTDFSCGAHPNTHSLSEAVRTAIGVNGGALGAAMSHRCVDCTHLKRYHSDLIADGVVLGDELNVAGVPAEANANELPDIPADPAADQLPPQQQQAPEEGMPRGYTRLAVMDGKTISHRKCVLDICEGPLVNYKDGRFCDGHSNLCDVCGIIPCGRPVRQPGALMCDDLLRIDWQRKYDNRFSRMSFPGVQRVIRRQQADGENGGETGPALCIELGALGETPGNQVIHSFRAKTTYCLQTVQWACGYPIGWGKCYRSESSPQVLAILDRIWAEYPESKPSFIAYDDACSLLHSTWLLTMKFIVDAWHYIGHRATDILCRLWCNPAPTNGSQPDLILVAQDENGSTHQTRAFNTETAEQLNSWLSGFEPQLRQMLDVNYDFFVHVLMMTYAERVQKQVEKKYLGLSEEFWAEATGV
ncbi:hypothetical protein DFH08DRAFT_917265 [Mycena albidolilacea]|uniref:CxC6 like cysteine cluster associated with KDZ domain-containing protein n=1 Tax=Mycena albidolilacea TaxID=1033008 RepID=A0AAD6ZH55_9AGAR|nr:hypothetical protein DFH08DRAFT_917265 [Mycena albidolilacea]